MPSHPTSCWDKRVTDIVQEGEEKVVDFPDDEPYGVEALLIYLYTLKFPYPTLVLEEPEIEEPASTSGETGSTTATANTYRWTRDSNCFKIKSRGAEELWQEQLGLYCIAHRLGLTFLATLSMVIMTNNIDESLRSSTVKMFIRRLYCLEHPEIQQLKDRVAEKVADQGSCDFFGNELSAIITSHPDFGYDLVKAMAEKDKRQMEMIAELTRPSDKQKKRPRLIGDVSDDSSAEY
jgi:hypothetical protein